MLLQPSHLPLTSSLLKSRLKQAIVEPTLGMIECNDARKEIKQAIVDSIKKDKINHYKALIKRKKRHYLSKRQENLLHLSKMAPKKFWRQILTCKTKEDNKIALKDWFLS